MKRGRIIDVYGTAGMFLACLGGQDVEIRVRAIRPRDRKRIVPGKKFVVFFPNAYQLPLKLRLVWWPF